MIDEQKLLDWLSAGTREKHGAERIAYRRLLSKIENGEFEVQGNTFRQPSWKDDDDQW